MVSQNQEPEGVQAPLIETDTGGDTITPTPDNPLISEIDRLNNAPDIDISEVPADPVPPVETPPAEPVVPAEPVAEQPTETPATPSQPSSPEDIQRLQQQAAEYEQVRQRAALQQQEQQLRQRLIDQGASEENAQLQARQYVQGMSAQQDLMRKAEEYGQHLLAVQAAAEQFASKYNLQVADLATLRQADTPEVMENMAKEIVERRNLESELERLRKAQVPAQQFDNSQGAPEVASSDENWVDRYNAGDRSPNAVAAAKRLLGM
jgi:membrane-associated HD superfamily phosphohydrolase